jgi:hypothetical protein
VAELETLLNGYYKLKDSDRKKFLKVLLEKYKGKKQLLDILNHIKENDPAQDIRYLARELYARLRSQKSDSSPGEKKVEEKITNQKSNKLEESIYQQMLKSPEDKLPALLELILKKKIFSFLPYLIRFLLEKENISSDLKATIVKFIGYLAKGATQDEIQKAKNLIFDFLERNESYRVKANCLESLLYFSLSDEELKKLISYKEVKDNRVRANLAFLLFKYSPEAAQTILKELVFSQHESERDSGYWLSFKIDPQFKTGEYLFQALEKEESEHLLGKVFNYISKLQISPEEVANFINKSQRKVYLQAFIEKYLQEPDPAPYCAK